MNGTTSLLARSRERRALRFDPSLARLIRVNSALTQMEIGKALGVGPFSVSRWETGRRTPTRKLLARYQKLLNRLAAEVK